MRGRPEPQEWYFFKAGSDAGLKAGPFSWERLLVQAQGGSLEPNDVVWDPNSGWQTAAQVPGLFPDLPAAPAMESTFSDTPPPGPPKERSRRFWWYLAGAIAAVVIVGVGLGLYFGLSGGDDDGVGGDVSVTTVSMSTSSTDDGGPADSTTSSASTSTTEGADADADTDITAGSDDAEPVAYLDRGDSGNQVSLRVGDRIRIDVEPWIGDSITHVFWDLLPAELTPVQVVDSGQEVEDGAVVGAYVVLEAVDPGRATVRAEYEYPNGTTEAKFVAYLFIRE